MRRVVLFIVFSIPLAFCIALICLPFYMDWGSPAKICFAGAGVTAICGLIAFISNGQCIDYLLGLMEDRVEEAIIGLGFAIPALLLNCLFLKKLLEGR